MYTDREQRKQTADWSGVSKTDPPQAQPNPVYCRVPEQVTTGTDIGLIEWDAAIAEQRLERAAAQLINSRPPPIQTGEIT